MPGPASHLTIVERQTTRLTSTVSAQHPVRRALTAAPNHAALGSIGPDMIFWADWGEYTPVVSTIFDIYHTLDEIYDALMELWGPIQNAIDKVESSLTGGLSDSINDTVSLLSATINTAILNYVTNQFDILSLLRPEMQKSGHLNTEVDWNWLDYLHHRRTGVMVKSLINRAQARGSDDLLGYAYGWLSHVTADVVGHPYVNVAVGGPYRSHWQRHFVQEKFMDTWVWGFYHTSGVGIPAGPPASGLPWDYASFTNVNSSSLHTRIDVGSDLPHDLNTLIVQALEDTYLNVPHPNVKGTIPFLGADEVNRAYQMLLTGLETITGKDRYIPRPKPPSVFNDDAPPTFPLPGGGSGGSGGSGGGSFSLSKLLEAIWDFVRDMLEYAADLALWLISQVTTPLTYPVRYALYLLQLALYEAYRHFRWGLAISGWVFPEPDELGNAMAQQFINPAAASFADVLTRPLQEHPPEQEKCAFFPASPLEPSAWAAGPYCRYPMNYPYWFIELEPTDPQFERIVGGEITAEEAHRFVNSRLRPAGTRGYAGSLGNALDFFMRRADEIEADGGGPGKLLLPDWNLDGDRGYAARCWKLTVPPSTPPNDLVPPNPTGVELTYL
jgi:hypothetical protein